MGRPARLALAAAAIAAGLVVIAAATRPDGRVHVVVFDVGQGDAILVETAHGGRVLVDGGPDPERLLVALDRRVPPWDRHLDLVVLTHPHEDHVGGLPLVIERYAVGRVLDTGARGTGPGFAAWTRALEHRGIETGRLLAGATFALDGVRFEAVWPDAAAVPAEPTDDGSALNDASIVILGEAGGRRFLLAGDVEAAAEAIVVARGLPRVDLLKVGHHGSAGSSTAALLDALRPSVAVISVAARNDFGHPSPATLAALAERAATIYRTDRQGTIDAALEEARVTVRAERDVAAPAPASARAANAPAVSAGPADRDPARPAPGGRVERAPSPCAMGGLTPSPGVIAAVARAGRASRRRPLAYHRDHVRPQPRRGCRAPPLAPAAGLAPAPLPGGGRDRGLAGVPHREPIR
jgi:competence protein ComEC